jgi:hypothetical protein
MNDASCEFYNAMHVKRNDKHGFHGKKCVKYLEHVHVII